MHTYTSPIADQPQASRIGKRSGIALQSQDLPAACILERIVDAVNGNELSIVEKVGGRVITDDHAMMHHENSPAEEGDDIDVVADKDFGDVEIRQDFTQELFAPGIKVAGWLIEDHHPGTHGKHSGNSEPFALPGTQVMGDAIFES